MGDPVHLSPYNVAVDEAVLSVSRAAAEPLQILRLGRAGAEVRRRTLDLDSQLEELATDNGLLEVARELLAAAMAKHPGQRVTLPATVRGCLDELGALVIRRRATREDPATVALLANIRALRSRYRAPAEQLLNRATVVGCTMSLAFLKDSLFSRPFDHLIVDEASVVRTPEAVVAVTRAGVPVTFLGDPKQLPPIVEARGAQTEQWLARSPFDMARISRPADAGGTCVMLDEQHRMAPPIRDLVSGLFYGGALRDGCYAPPSGRVVVVDSSGCGARATPKMIRLRNSKENLLHRAIVAEVLRAVGRDAPDAHALVLSPFVAQKRAYRRERTSTEALRNAPRFETIHSSQGTEQDVVVLDLVLAGSGIGTKSRMLNEHQNAHLANLLNVAVSRAKHTFVIVGDLDLVQREYRGALLDQLVTAARRTGTYVQVQPRLGGLARALTDAFGS